MKKQLLILLAYYFFCGVAAAFAQAIPNARTLIEVLQGTVDGINVTFSMTNAPVDPPSIQLFCNGIEDANAKFRLDGRKLIFEHPPLVGSMLSVAYMVPADNAFARANSAPTATSGYAMDIATEQLEQSIQREIAALSSAGSTRETILHEKALAPSPSRQLALEAAPSRSQQMRSNGALKRTPSFASIDMLSRAVTTAMPEGGAASIRQKTLPSISAEGIEGLGDEGATSIFAQLKDPSQLTATERLVLPENSGTKDRRVPRKMPLTSLGILAKRLASPRGED